MGYSAGAGLVYADRIVHEGGRNVTYDLLGTHSEFKFESEYVYYVKGVEQVITLPYPSFVLCPGTGSTVYGISVSYYDTVTSTWVDMPYDTDAASTEVDAGTWHEVAEDATAMAKAHSLWNDATYNFNGVLANQIRIKLANMSGSVSTNINVKVTYQVLYKDIVDCDAFRTQTGPQYSRELGQNILDRLDILENRTRVMNRNMFGSVMYSNDILNEDLTGINADNRIQYEMHEVDTSTGHTLISPTQGSFYPGVVNSQMAFKMFRYKVDDNVEISEGEITLGTHLGWLFEYTVNAHQVYEVTSDSVFLDKAAYYKCVMNTGAYKRLVKGEEAEVRAGTADYMLGYSTSYVRSTDTAVNVYKKYYTLNYDTKVFTQVESPASTANPLTSGWFEGTEVYLRRNVAYDPDRKAFDSVVNDTSARISKEMRVILTRDNISKYTNYKGKCIDVSMTSTYTITADETFEDTPTYYKRTVQTDGTYLYTELTKGTRAEYEAGTVDYYVGLAVPVGGTVYVGNDSTLSRELLLGTDYEFCDVNVAKTEQTYIDQPVYDHVRLLTPLTTDESYLVGISYQAFGGQVRPDDVRNLRNDVKNALTILGEHQLLTVENLDKQVVIKDLIARLRRMENYHFHFHQVDHEVFRGGSLGVSGATSAGFHWINIAQIYDVAWMNENDVIQEIGTFRVYSKLLRWCYEFTVSVNLGKSGVDRMIVRTLGATTQNTTDPSALTTVTDKENLFLRLCWNNDGTDTGCKTGLVLQLGWDYSVYDYSSDDDWLYDTITVTNKSGNTAHWSLYYNPLETTKYTDAAINAYGHVKYVKIETGTTITDTSIPYFTPVDDYIYYLATSTYAVSGVKYYMRNTGSSAYVEVSIKTGTKLADLGYTVYERSVYRSRYVQTSLSFPHTVTASESIWKIDSSVSYTDDHFSLPNGDTWDSGTTEKCEQVTRTIESDENGVLMWSGSVPLAGYSFGPNKEQQTLTLHASIAKGTQDTLSLNSATKMTVVIYDRKNDTYIFRTVNAASENIDREANETAAETLFYLEDMCGMHLRVHEDGSDDPYQIITIELGLGTSSQINDRFDLRQIWVNF